MSAITIFTMEGSQIYTWAVSCVRNLLMTWLIQASNKRAKSLTFVESLNYVDCMLGYCTNGVIKYSIIKILKQIPYIMKQIMSVTCANFIHPRQTRLFYNGLCIATSSANFIAM